MRSLHVVATSLLVLAICALATPAEAAIAKDKLVGTWKGSMNMTIGDDKAAVDVTMIFRADGTMSLQSEEDKAEETTYVIETDSVLLKDPSKNGDDMRLKSVQLDAKSLKADVVPVKGDAMPEGVKIQLDLKRQ